MKSEDRERLQKAFGKIIEQQRLEGNISQAELAEAGDFNRTYISELERGIKQPSLSTVVRLAYAFEIRPSDLIIQLEELIEIR